MNRPNLLIPQTKEKRPIQTLGRRDPPAGQRAAERRADSSSALRATAVEGVVVGRHALEDPRGWHANQG